MPSYTPINQSQGAAPPARSAPQPGMGRGNVPFAPGVISGNLGQQTNPTPTARQAGGINAQSAPVQGPPPPAPQGQVPQAQPPGGQPSGPGAAGPTPAGVPNTQAIAAFYLNFLESYLLAIKESVDKPLVGGMY